MPIHPLQGPFFPNHAETPITTIDLRTIDAALQHYTGTFPTDPNLTNPWEGISRETFSRFTQWTQQLLKRPPPPNSHIALNGPTASQIEQRSKQLSFGRVTTGYYKYQAISIIAPSHPRCLSPDPRMDLPKRQWDTLNSEWRRRLHLYENVVLTSEQFTQTAYWQTVALPKILNAQAFVAALKEKKEIETV